MYKCSVINTKFLAVRLDVHHRLETGCHYQAAQTDRRAGRSSGEGATDKPSVWCEGIQWHCADH